MRVVGVISGTSHDAIETAAAELTLDGDQVVATFLGSASTPFPPELRAAVAACLPPGATTVGQICRLDTRLGQAFAEAAARAIDEICGGHAELVVSHGQTVYHWVAGGRALGTLQLGQPAWIAERTGLPVVSDLRARDVARGGQGAPLVSLLDTLLLGPVGAPRAALNLGGIANITVVSPDGAALAYDTGPANALIDAAVEHATGGAEQLDRDGRRARRGQVVPALLAELLADPYYRQPPPKSTGKERFNAAYLRSALTRHPGLAPDDVVATLTRLTARTVADACLRHGVTTVHAAGGGVHNPVLMADLAAHLPGVVLGRTDELGIPAGAKEAFAFALLGFLTVHGVPGTVPSCTGASGPSLLGSLTPGRLPLRLPPPAGTVPRRLLLAAAPRPVGTPVRLRAVAATGPTAMADLTAMARVFHAAWHGAYRGVLPDDVVDAVDPVRAGVIVGAGAATGDVSCTLAETGAGTVVGWVRHGVAPDGSAQVHSLYVDPAYAGGGVGRQLLRHAAVDAATRGHTELTLWVFEANAAARRFYARHGLRPDGGRLRAAEFGDQVELRLRSRLPLAGPGSQPGAGAG
ncbi:MAG: anhydro-N-acetylmuramic acid kinase [Actinobacteria bacterium]|nr:anhydro-N-acetylmuramic acid kinase [Actinomycetota bacterium]